MGFDPPRAGCSLAALICVLTCAYAAAAQEPTAAHKGNLKLELSVPPSPPLVLGKVERTTLTVKIKNLEGQPVDRCDVRVNSNVGSFSKERRRSAGVFTFDYRLPKEYYPQYVVLAASATCDRIIAHEWLVVPLMGTGKAQVKAKPRSQVILRVGESTFGPVRSDKKGEALIPIVVPPGIEYGYSEYQKIDLKLPPFNRICVLAEKANVKAKTGQTRLRIYVINKKGQPARKAKLTMTAKHGAVGEISRIKKGVYAAAYHSPGATKSLTDTVTARLKNQRLSTEEITLGIGSQTPSKISISPSKESDRPGGGGKITLKIAVTDDAGSPANGTLELRSTVGQLTPPEKIETGIYRSELFLPDHLDGLEKSTVRAEVISPRPPHKKIHAERDIALPSADTRERDGLFAVEPSVGFLTNFGNLNTALFSLELQPRLWFILKGLYALVDATYFFDIKSAGHQGVSSTLHALPLFAGLGYQFRPTRQLNIFASAGGGLSFLWFETIDENGFKQRSKKAVPAVRAALGGSLDAGPGAVSVTLLYQWFEPDAFKALKGTLSGLGIEAGYRFSF